MAPKLAVIFRLLVRRASFPECWRSANITPIPKGSSPSIHPSDYRPISITPVLSKIYERLLAKRLIGFLNKNKLLPERQFGFRKGMSTSDALLCITHDLQTDLDRGNERLVSLDFSSALDRVNHKALLFKIRSLGIGDRLLGILEQFLRNRKQRVLVDGYSSSFCTVKSGVPQGSVLGPLLFIIFTSDMWSNIESNMVAYADDTTLFASIPSPHHRRSVADILCRDVWRILSWCSLWGMQLNPSKSKSLIVSRSRTLFPAHPDIIIGDVAIPNCSFVKLLGVTLDPKLTFERHLRDVASMISQKVGILRRCRQIYSSDDIVRNCFYSFLLPNFEYCHSVFISASDTSLGLLGRAFNQIRFLLPNLNISLEHRRRVGFLTHFFKIVSDPEHPLHGLLPPHYRPARDTRQSRRSNNLSFVVARVNTSQFSRSFFPAAIRLWNDLPNDIVYAASVDAFKSKVNVLFLP